MDKKTRMRWKGLHFLSSRQNEISTEALSSEKQGLSAGGHYEDPLLAERQLGHPERGTKILKRQTPFSISGLFKIEQNKPCKPQKY